MAASPSSQLLSPPSNLYHERLLSIPKPFTFVRPLTRYTVGPTRLRVSATSEPDQQEPKRSSSTDSSPKPAAPTKVTTDFRDVFAFAGPAPERINGRLAMLGFVAALGVELTTGSDLVSQLSHGGITWFVVTALLISGASLVPMFQGVSTESRSQRIMSAGAELLNGRAAMIGLVALAITEYVKMGPLV